MSHMQPEVYEDDYYSVETNYGATCIVPVDVVGTVDSVEDLADYCDGEPVAYERWHGWLARMHAPGYLDATKWTACGTECEAWGYLLECYGTTDGALEDWEADAIERLAELGGDASAWRDVFVCDDCGHADDAGAFAAYEHIPHDAYTITPSGRLGGKVAVGCGGDYLDEFDTTENALAFIAERMDGGQYWPDVIWISDHGNWWLVDRSGNEIKPNCPECNSKRVRQLIGE